MFGSIGRRCWRSEHTKSYTYRSNSGCRQKARGTANNVARRGVRRPNVGIATGGAGDRVVLRITRADEPVQLARVIAQSGLHKTRRDKILRAEIEGAPSIS